MIDVNVYWVVVSIVVATIFFMILSYLLRKKQTDKILDAIEDLHLAQIDLKRDMSHKFELLDKTLDRLIERDMERRIEKRLLDVTPLLETKPRRGRPKKESS